MRHIVDDKTKEQIRRDVATLTGDQEQPAPPRARLYAAIAAVMGALESIAKDSQNEQQHYKYAGEAAIANTLRPLMSKNGLSILLLSSEMLAEEVYETGKGAKMRRALMRMCYRVAHSSGECVDSAVVTEGLDNLDKAIPKAMTMAYKYLLIETFCVGRGDDPDAGKGYEGADESGQETGAGGEDAAPFQATADTYEGKFTRSDSRTGRNDRGPWRRFSFQGQDGKWYSTFDTKMGALIANNPKATFAITYEEKGGNLNITEANKRD